MDHHQSFNCLFIILSKAFRVRFKFYNVSKNNQPTMADNSQKMSYHAGEAKGQAQEKTSSMMDRANNAAQSAKESVQQVGMFTTRHMNVLLV